MKKMNQVRFYERDRMKPERPVLLWTLFVIYLAVMTWIVLFKFAVSADQLPYIEEFLNLVPFQESLIINDRLDLSEIIMNGVVFLPFRNRSCRTAAEGSVLEEIPVFRRSQSDL